MDELIANHVAAARACAAAAARVAEAQSALDVAKAADAVAHNAFRAATKAIDDELRRLATAEG